MKRHEPDPEAIERARKHAEQARAEQGIPPDPDAEAYEQQLAERWKKKSGR